MNLAGGNPRTVGINATTIVGEISQNNHAIVRLYGKEETVDSQVFGTCKMLRMANINNNQLVLFSS
jgi:hypothetical protein